MRKDDFFAHLKFEKRSIQCIRETMCVVTDVEKIFFSFEKGVRFEISCASFRFSKNKKLVYFQRLFLTTSKIEFVLYLGILGGLILLDVEVFQGVLSLVRGKDTEPVTEGLLLEELLGQVLEVLLTVLHGGGNRQYLAVQGDLNLVTELALNTIQLGVGGKVLLEGRHHVFVKDTVVHGGTQINFEHLLSLREGGGADVTAGTDLLTDSYHFIYAVSKMKDKNDNIMCVVQVQQKQKTCVLSTTIFND